MLTLTPTQILFGFDLIHIYSNAWSLFSFTNYGIKMILRTWHNKSLLSTSEQYGYIRYNLPSKSKRRQLGPPEESVDEKFSLCAKFLCRSMPFSFCLAFLRRLRELVCTLRAADMLLSVCLLVFISNREWLAFCIYNACPLWGCYRCHRETPYKSLLVDFYTNIIVLPS